MAETFFFVIIIVVVIVATVVAMKAVMVAATNATNATVAVKTMAVTVNNRAEADAVMATVAAAQEAISKLKYSVLRLMMVTTLEVVTILLLEVETKKLVVGFVLAIIATTLAFWPGCERHERRTD